MGSVGDQPERSTVVCVGRPTHLILETGKPGSGVLREDRAEQGQISSAHYTRLSTAGQLQPNKMPNDKTSNCSPVIPASQE